MFRLFKKDAASSATNKSYKQYWLNRHDENSEFRVKDVATDPFLDWDLNTMPESSVEWNMFMALEICYANADESLAHRYLQRCLQVVERIFHEDRLIELHKRGKGLFPVNRAAVYRAQAYAQALLGRGLDKNLLARAATDYEDYCNGEGKSPWDSQAQCYYLNAVTLILLAGDRQRARELLAIKRSFKWHAEQFVLYQELAQTTTEPPIQDPTLPDRFGRFFDEIRNPGYDPEAFIEKSTLRFELGALRDKYFISQNGEIDWQRVIDAVSR